MVTVTPTHWALLEFVRSDMRRHNRTLKQSVETVIDCGVDLFVAIEQLEVKEAKQAALPSVADLDAVAVEEQARELTADS